MKINKLFPYKQNYIWQISAWADFIAAKPEGGGAWTPDRCTYGCIYFLTRKVWWFFYQGGLIYLVAKAKNK